MDEIERRLSQLTVAVDPPPLDSLRQRASRNRVQRVVLIVAPLGLLAVALYVVGGWGGRSPVLLEQGQPAPVASGADQAGAVDCPDWSEAKTRVEGPLAEEDVVAQGQLARAAVGLASDESTVRAVMEETNEDGWILGFPHTVTELEHLTRASGTANRAGELRRWAETEAREHFAGLWVDYASGGALTVAFVEDVDRYRAEIKARFDERIRVVEAAHALISLQAIANEAQAEMTAQSTSESGTAPGSIIGVTVDEEQNRVVLRVVEPDEERRLMLADKYGSEAICLRPHPADER